MNNNSGMPRHNESELAHPRGNKNNGMCKILDVLHIILN
ncbi:hypothetical protein C3B79_0431 [Aeromonas hydrophila]|nr:hypothetical protein C3B79_0431 [Aeromonas hydrophila]